MQTSTHVCLRFANHLSPKALAAFLLSLSLCSVIIGIAIHHHAKLERMAIEQAIADFHSNVAETIARVAYKAEALAAVLVHENGEIPEFKWMDAIFVDDPAIDTVAIAPSGVVSAVYPAKGSIRSAGYALPCQGKCRNLSCFDREKSPFHLSGPVESANGRQVLVGRRPVWIEAPSGKKEFWGVVEITMKHPEALNGAGLDALKKKGFEYEVWRRNPSDGLRKRIAGDVRDHDPPAQFIEKCLPILNEEWCIRILTVREWYEYPLNWAVVGAGLLISALIAGITQSNCDLQTMKGKLESMVMTDPLTGLLNRKGLFAALDKLAGSRTPFRLYYLDLDHFKRINDSYGHGAGDFALVEFCRKMRGCLDERHIFARISGDEFALVLDAPSPDSRADGDFWEAVAGEFAKPVFLRQGEGVVLTFSKGMAAFPENGRDIGELLSFADKKMYMQKHWHYFAEKGRRATDLRIVAE